MQRGSVELDCMLNFPLFLIKQLGFGNNVILSEQLVFPRRRRLELSLVVYYTFLRTCCTQLEFGLMNA